MSDIPPPDWWTSFFDTQPVLIINQSGPFVRRMQHLLVPAYTDAGLTPPLGPPESVVYDSTFGQGTEDVLNAYKSFLGLNPDGYCDQVVWNALMDSAVGGIPVIQRDDTGPYVVRMQHLLASENYLSESDAATYSGTWDEDTDYAKFMFNQNRRLSTTDSTCEEKSWKALLNGQSW